MTYRAGHHVLPGFLAIKISVIASYPSKKTNLNINALQNGIEGRLLYTI